MSLLGGRVAILIEKEWLELRRRRVILASVIVLPLALLATTFVFTFLLPGLIGDSFYEDPSLDRALAKLALDPELAVIGPGGLFEVLLLRQFLILLLIVPVGIGISIATYSVVGEKVTRSLEPLLATPITTAELLWGKTLAAAIPAVAVTWATFAVFAAGVALWGQPGVFSLVMNGPACLVVALIAPLVAILGLSLGILVSSRVNDPRTAQQVSVIVILPLVALSVSQLKGLLSLTAPVVLLAVAVLALADLLVVRVGVVFFERERILTRWK